MESGSVSAALMQLFYYQQGFFTEGQQPSLYSHDVEGGSLLREVGVPPWQVEPRSRSGFMLGPGSRESMHVPATQVSTLPSVDELTAERWGSRGDSAGAAADGTTSVRALLARRSELQWRLETGILHKENEALTSQVLRMHEEENALEVDYKEMKDRFSEDVEALSRQLEAQQGITSAAERRVVCAEDLIRFHGDQRTQMQSHWKTQCQMKDERIHDLSMQLTDYRIDFQHVGTQKQTAASLSHELQCLEDRHGELRVDRAQRCAHGERLRTHLAELRAEAAELRTEETEVHGRLRPPAWPPPPSDIEVNGVGLRSQLRLLCEWQKNLEARAPSGADVQWPHVCIWRDELDVRERQLEKITAQLDRTNNALHAAQAALTQQRARTEEMKSKHREAEAGLRQGEQRRAAWQQRCMEMRRAEAELRRVLETSMVSGAGGALSSGATAAAAGSSPRDPGGNRVGVNTNALRHAFSDGNKFVEFRPQPRVSDGSTSREMPPIRPRPPPPLEPPTTGVATHAPVLPSSTVQAQAALPLEERIAAIGRETRRIVALRQGGGAAGLVAPPASAAPVAAASAVPAAGALPMAGADDPALGGGDANDPLL